MGSSQLLNAMLHRTRAALRLDGLGVLAGHGVADQVYRPPHLPYASIVGPLGLETESERDVPARMVRVLNPGYLAGVPRTAVDNVPAAGVLGLVVDSTATGAVPVDFGALAGTPITAEGTGPRIAAALQAAIVAAVAVDAFTEGAPISDSARLAELRAVIVRWDPVLDRLVISSGRRGPVTADPRPGVSRVATAAQPVGDVAPALGLAAGAVTASGTITRSRDTPPTAVAIDVRLDLWAGTQAELARLLDAWCAVTPTRSELLLGPTPLAADAAPGDTSVRLLFGALPRTPATVVSAGPVDGFVDRISGRAPALAGTVLTSSAIRLAGGATATFRAVPVRPIADAWHPNPAGLRGWSADLDLRAAAAAAVGDSGQVLRVGYGPRTVLMLSLVRDTATRYLLRGTAESADGTPFATAGVALDANVIEGAARVHVHVSVDAAAGAVRLLAERGTVQPVMAAVPGAAAAGVDEDVVLTLGDPGGPGLDIEIGEVQLNGRPLGPADSRLRRLGPAASDWTPGDRLVLTRSLDGFSGSGPTFDGYVLGVDGAALHLDRPITEGFPRGASIAHAGRLFMAQRQLRRNDDLMNRIYRVAFEYRISAFLDDTMAAVSAPLVERPEVEVRELARLIAEQADPLAPVYPPRPAAQAVGISTRITTSAARSSTSSGSGSSGAAENQP